MPLSYHQTDPPTRRSSASPYTKRLPGIASVTDRHSFTQSPLAFNLFSDHASMSANCIGGFCFISASKRPFNKRQNNCPVDRRVSTCSLVLALLSRLLLSLINRSSSPLNISFRSKYRSTELTTAIVP